MHVHVVISSCKWFKDVLIGLQINALRILHDSALYLFSMYITLSGKKMLTLALPIASVFEYLS